jgi:pseudouridine synthase
MGEPLRLNRFLAAAGVASRRRCDDLILRGRVTVNGTRVDQLGTRVTPDQDVVALDGRTLSIPHDQWMLLLNKPRDVLVAASDARGRSTVMDLLADFPGRVFPVGRLDYRSEGLLLFTNDGDLAYRLAHPRFKVSKLYHVHVDGPVASAVVEAFRRGVILDDGPTLPARVRQLSSKRGRAVLEIELKEGRKRQIRRMLALFGHEVIRLRRIRLGPLEIGSLNVGKWRELDSDEVSALRAAVGIVDGGAKGGSH